MADQLPVNFSIPPESAVASYNYSDIVNGLGFATFYAASTSLSAGTEYILTDQALYSSDIEVSRNANGTTTITFTSSTFNSQRLAKGTAFFSCGLAGNGGQHYVTAKLQHYDGASATDISSQITSATLNATGGAVETMILLQLPLTEKNFAIGDSVRLVVTLVSTGATGYVGIDPAGRSGVILGTDATTVMKVNIPFKINL